MLTNTSPSKFRYFASLTNLSHSLKKNQSENDENQNDPTSMISENKTNHPKLTITTEVTTYTAISKRMSVVTSPVKIFIVF